MLIMPDLMIAFSAAPSRKNGFIVLETYYTKQIGVSKAGKYKGGSITAADVLNCLPVQNASSESIQKWFSEFAYQIGKNVFYVTVENFRELHHLLASRPVLFLDHADASLTLITKIEANSSHKRAKYQYSIGNSLFSCYSDGTLCIEKTPGSVSQIRTVCPVPHLYYSTTDQAYLLLFEYGGKKAAYMDKGLSVKTENAIYLRNFQYESKIGQELQKNGFLKLTKGRYAYSGRKNISTLHAMLSESGIILDDDKSTIIPNIKIARRESGWFEVDLSYDIGDKIIDLASKIQLFTNKNELEVGDKRIVLPDSVVQAKDDFVLKDNKLYLHQKHIFQLLRLIYSSGSQITDFFSYSDVKPALPEILEKTALPYQREGVQWLKFLFLNHLGGCLADDMGLGKTFQVIAFLEDNDVRKRLQKVLIVVPKSLLTNWKREFEKFSSSYRVGIYHGNKRSELDFDRYDVVITTYNTALLDKDYLNGKGFTIIVLDEIQTIKNYKSITSQAIKEIHAAMKIGLSGTPMENGISELWNVMDIVNPGALPSHSAFLHRYQNRNYDELKEILNLFILRRMKKDVLKQLPPKYEQIIYCDMDAAQRRLYTGINIAVKTAISRLKAFAAPVVLKGLTLLRECCCHPLLLDDNTNVEGIQDSCKLDALKILVDNLFESGHKILIFSNYTAMLQLIQKELEKNREYKANLFYLDGKTKQRNLLVEQFEAADAGIFLISIKAGGVGLNLTSAQDVIIYDPWWNPFVEQQAVDRAYRIGQQQSVNVYKLVAANTIEEKILDMQKDKQQDFEELINGISTEKNVDLNKILSLL